MLFYCNEHQQRPNPHTDGCPMPSRPICDTHYLLKICTQLALLKVHEKCMHNEQLSKSEIARNVCLAANDMS